MIYKHTLDLTDRHKNFIHGTFTITDLCDLLILDLERLTYTRTQNKDRMQEILFAARYVRENLPDLNHYEVVLDKLFDFGEMEDGENLKNLKLFFGEIDGRWHGGL